MSNVLQFALGLSAGNFLSGANAAKLATGGLLAAATGLGVVMAGVSAQMRRGAGLNDLANRTGESVTNLVKLQRGFEITGINAEQVTGIIGALQRSLGGFNEMGQPTKDIFAGIGLSAQALKKQELPAVFEAVFASLRKLNNNDAANASGKIFGRGNGAAVLQAARDGNEFSAAMKRAANEAKVFERFAGMFDRIDDALVKLKASLDYFFARLGGSFAQVVLFAQQAFGDGKISDL